MNKVLALLGVLVSGYLVANNSMLLGLGLGSLVGVRGSGWWSSPS